MVDSGGKAANPIAKIGLVADNEQVDIRLEPAQLEKKVFFLIRPGQPRFLEKNGTIRVPADNVRGFDRTHQRAMPDHVRFDVHFCQGEAHFFSHRSALWSQWALIIGPNVILANLKGFTMAEKKDGSSHKGVASFASDGFTPNGTGLLQEPGCPIFRFIHRLFRFQLEMNIFHLQNYQQDCAGMKEDIHRLAIYVRIHRPRKPVKNL